MFVISLTYLVPLSEIDALRPAHLKWLQSYYNQGVLLVSGRKNPPTGGMIIAHGVTREKLDTILAEDPFAVEGVASYEVTEFVPAMAAPALSFLVE